MSTAVARYVLLMSLLVPAIPTVSHGKRTGVGAPIGGPPAQAQSAEPGLQIPSLPDAIRNRLEAGNVRGEWSAAGDPILAIRALPAAYLSRQFAPIWIRDGQLSPEVGPFLDYLRRAREEGLNPLDYHLDALDSLGALLQGEPGTGIGPRVDYELLLSDAFLVYGSHLLQGRVNPVSIDPEWLANRRNVSMESVLAAAAETGRFEQALDGLLPRQPGYSRLKNALARLREEASAGGWEEVPEGRTLREGDTDPRVVAVRTRLSQSGDQQKTVASGGGSVVVSPAADPTVFDSLLTQAVQRFQTRHGLDADGAVGAATLGAMNVPVEARIRQIEVNLERWRWLPEDLGSRYILVNIAGFSATVVEDGRRVLEMRAIVGRQYRQTPVFSGLMTYLVLSPYWHVPPTIAAVDKLPEIKKDLGYIAAQRMVLLDAATNQVIDPASVNWAEISGPEFNRRYRLRQDPGPNNALGDVKFMFPNPYNVYLHDTPSRELFARSERGFSSGCIRIERPLELAEYLLRGDPRWSAEGIRSAVERRQETTVTLRNPIPVHIEYWTTWVEDDGRLDFRRDLYGRDAVVDEALTAHPPGM
jgi:murein L,D-transpeptidase YcbB/YkuD